MSEDRPGALAHGATRVQHRGVGDDRTSPVRRTTVAEAAVILGISAEAVRGRIRRGTLPVERRGGSVYVLLEEARGRTTDDQSRTTVDQPTDRTELLIAELQDRVRSLEEANRENRRIIAALTSRIPELEASTSQERESSTNPISSDTSSAGSTTPRVETPSPNTESGFINPVAEIPYWQYSLLVLWWVAWMTIYSLFLFYDPLELWRAGYWIDFVVNFLILLLGPITSGYWIGSRKLNANVSRDFLPIGLIATLLGSIFLPAIDYLTYLRQPVPRGVPKAQLPELLEIIVNNMPAYLAINLIAFIVYIFASIWANGRQRKREGVRSLVSDTHTWTAEQQTMIGFYGVIISALVGLVGNIIVAVVGN